MVSKINSVHGERVSFLEWADITDSADKPGITSFLKEEKHQYYWKECEPNKHTFWLFQWH